MTQNQKWPKIKNDPKPNRAKKKKSPEQKGTRNKKKPKIKK